MNVRTSPRVLAAAGLALTLTLTACGGADDAATTTAPPATTAAVMTPMSSMTGGTTASGSTSTVRTADGTTGSGTADTTHNDADVLFVQQMIPHHEGAIAMAALAADRASAQAVKDLATRIQGEQQPEIDEMNSWLDAWGAASGTASDPTAMDMGAGAMATATESSGGMTMNGMMSADDMAGLAAADGADFDRLFLELMIVHHQGAIDMADVEIGAGADPAALALAASIRSGQTAEIARMQSLLAGM